MQNSGSLQELLHKYALHNIWANRLLINLLGNLPNETLHTKIVSSFNSLYATVLHIYDAESIWWQRLKLDENIHIPSSDFDKEFSVLSIALLKQSEKFAIWIQQANENQLQHVFAYRREKHIEKIKVADMFLHLFNHNSFHRGQLITQLRQLGCKKMPPTDFLAYLRQKNKF